MNERAEARPSIEPGTSEVPASPLLRIVALAQALYYIPTGIWALVSIDTFQKVTGPKTDLWLVKTVGLLITVVGAALTMAGVRRRMGPELPLLGIGSAAALTTIDVVYVARRRISPIYLLDALGEVLLIGGWIVALRGRR
ncbi:MAG TPA: hypothetical protein VGD69_27880 [Herpetosiphonaceae bacterium]